MEGIRLRTINLVCIIGLIGMVTLWGCTTRYLGQSATPDEIESLVKMGRMIKDGNVTVKQFLDERARPKRREVFWVRDQLRMGDLVNQPTYSSNDEADEAILKEIQENPLLKTSFVDQVISVGDNDIIMLALVFLIFIPLIFINILAHM
jgi:hypothetical protein